MALAAGTRLGPYEILSRAGAGGMGEVYRARDTRLDRTVAIKVLPDHLRSNPGLKQRFEREARAASALNHQHICQLYDVGSQDGTDFIVMEYLDGQTLADRLEKGPLPLEQVLKIGAEIASALDKAHRKGIVHRDVKPGNIILTRSGAKLTDFGLAKPAGALLDADAPTLASAKPLTGEGTFLGTVQYMSPEVLQGGESDARSDIFGLGCVLYEMATGRRAFEGSSPVSVLAAILEKQPEPVANLQPTAPAALDSVIRACLAKDPDERIQNAHDVKLQLESIPAVAASSPSRARSRTSVVAWTLAALALVTAAALLLGPSLQRRDAPRILQFQVSPPEKTNFNFRGLGGPPTISPDGTRIVFGVVVPGKNGGHSLWLRRLDAAEPVQLPGTNEGTYPFWSADSRQIAFFANGTLKRLDLGSSTVLDVCGVAEGRGGAWSKDGTIIFGTRNAGIFKVPDTGGQPVAVTTANFAVELSHRWPQFLPDQNHFLFTSQAATSHILVGSLDGAPPKPVVEINSNAAFADGQLLYVQDNVLIARSFDPKRLEFTGQPVAVAQHVSTDPQFDDAVFAGSGDVLAYQPGTLAAGTRLVALDLAGNERTLAADSGFFGSISISPAGDQLLGTIAERSGVADIWIYDLAAGSKRRLTFDRRSHNAVWSPDGTRVAFARTRPNGNQIIIKNASGAGGEQVAFSGGKDWDGFPAAWTPDGRYIVYLTLLPHRGEIAVLPLAGDRQPVVLRAGEASLSAVSLSPDGKWLAYDAVTTGASEIYVVPFRPDVPGSVESGSKWQVSNGGGVRPKWSADGKAIYFTTPSETALYSARVRSRGDQFETSPAEYLFEIGAHPVVGFLAPAPDGRQLYMIEFGPGSNAPLTVTVNWRGLLKK